MVRSWKLFLVRLVFFGVWKDITSITIDFQAHNIDLYTLLNKEFGCGNQTSFWFKRWLGDSILKDKYPSLFKLETIKQCTVMDRCSKSDGIMDYSWKWSRLPSSLIKLDEIKRFLQELNEAILQSSNDTWKWLENTDGNFYVCSLRSM